MAKKTHEKDSSASTLIGVIRKSRVPILTLDERWHNLLPDEVKTPRIKELERRLNDLLKSQGKFTTDIEDLKKLKKKLMDEVLLTMEESSGLGDRLKQKKQDKIQKLILDINNKLLIAEDTLGDRPDEIKNANVDLLVECIRVWMEKLDNNRKEIEQIGEWVEMVRERLKDKLLIKQDKEIENNAMYSYMHSLLGPSVMEQIDARFDER